MEKVVTRAVCASISKFDGSVMHELLSIRNELCVPGRTARTRLAMLYTSRWFMLWVEGNDDDVDTVLRIVGSDPRIAHQKLLHRSRGPAQLVDRVAVSTTQAPIRPTQYARLVAQLAERGQRLEPIEIFRLMAAPCVIGAQGDLSVRPARHVALLSAEDNGPIDQLRKLGETFRTPVIYRRFGAGRRHTADVGISYVDVPVAEGIGRIHLLPRGALDQPTVRQSLFRLEALALLLGSHAASAAGIASALAVSLQGRQSLPTVYVSGTIEEGARACARLLSDHGVPCIELPRRDDAPNLASLLATFGWRTRGNSVGVAPGRVPAAGGSSHGWSPHHPLPTI